MGALGKEVRFDGKEEEEERLIEEGGVRVLDFDVLCSNVAMQSNKGKWRMWDNNEEDDDDGDDEDLESGEFGNGGGGGEFGNGGGGVLRMWEGEVLDCFDHRPIAIQSFCCPCYRFGKNMKRTGLGPCFIQGTIYFLLAVSALLNCIAFIMTRRNCFLYIAAAFSVSLGMYLGFFRTQTRKKFNIQGSDSSVDDCVYHLICPCCTISQESRTLEMNNVQGGIWHGRGDTICVGTVNGSGKAFAELSPPLPISACFLEVNTIPKV